MPLWVRIVSRMHIDFIINKVRVDTRYVPANQRTSTADALAYWAAIHRLRRKAYNSEAIISRSLFAVEDLAFNCILVRANELLAEIAHTIKEDLPEWLPPRMSKTKEALENLWDESYGQYFSRSFVTNKHIEEASIATLLPLYAGIVPEEKAQRLIELLKRKEYYGAKWPVPSVPVSSPNFNSVRYWQGPTWINTNWLIIDGLKRNGFYKESMELKKKTIELVKMSGFYEYFDPNSGAPAGAANFSWTAALTIDLLKS
jgi:glycogen debranching enzyme